MFNCVERLLAKRKRFLGSSKLNTTSRENPTPKPGEG